MWVCVRLMFDCECSSRGLYNPCTRFRKIFPFNKSSRRLQQQMECRIAGRNTDKRSTLTTPLAMEVRPRCTLCTCTPMVPAGISRLIMHTNADHGEDGAEAEPCQVRSKITMRQFLEIFAKWRMAQYSQWTPLDKKEYGDVHIHTRLSANAPHTHTHTHTHTHHTDIHISHTLC